MFDVSDEEVCWLGLYTVAATADVVLIVGKNEHSLSTPSSLDNHNHRTLHHTHQTAFIDSGLLNSFLLVFPVSLVCTINRLPGSF